MRRIVILGIVCMLTVAGAVVGKGVSPPTAKAALPTDLALDKPVLTSSAQDGQLAAGYAVDGSRATRWSSAWSDPQWLYVDLGSVHNIRGVTLFWETAYAKAFQIQVSNDASHWTTIYSTTSGTGGTQTLTGLSGSGRYVRMYGTARGTGWGYSLWEFDVYGKSTPASPAVPSDTSPPTISGTAQQGDALTAGNGSWSNSPTSYTYQWQDCTSASSCSNISGATSSTYTLQSTDVGKTVDVVVTATNAGGSGSATSAQTATVTAASSGGGLSPLHVVGNELENASGQQVVLHGTDVSGSSYACEQEGGYGFSDTPSGSSLFGPMVSNDGGSLSKNWTINSVTIGINQDCWLGINGVSSTYSGQNYINWVKAQVTSAESYGIYPVIGFFVGEPGTDTPNWSSTGNGNAPMPDNDHVPLVWEEMANTFKNDPNVIFRLYEEPWPESTGTNLATWQCWSQGDVQYGTSSDNTPPTAPTPVSSTEHCNPLNKDANGTAYSSVGMQSLINIIRGTGASNIIQVPGVAFANMLSCTNTESPTSCGFLDSADGVRVTDPLTSTNPSLGSQLMADTDNYPDMGQ